MCIITRLSLGLNLKTGFNMTMKLINTVKTEEEFEIALSAYLNSVEGLDEASNVYRQGVDGVERVMLKIMMRHNHNNQSRAAIQMGINRATLRTKLKRHNLM